ncbi:unnamed protein product [Symbiodinium sp. CCMP2592]|nr:unnamed protein product [Symbiodinium sp. CCMP2592]
MHTMTIPLFGWPKDEFGRCNLLLPPPPHFGPAPFEAPASRKLAKAMLNIVALALSTYCGIAGLVFLPAFLVVNPAVCVLMGVLVSLSRITHLSVLSQLQDGSESQLILKKQGMWPSLAAWHRSPKLRLRARSSSMAFASAFQSCVMFCLRSLQALPALSWM